MRRCVIIDVTVSAGHFDFLFKSDTDIPSLRDLWSNVMFRVLPIGRPDGTLVATMWSGCTDRSSRWDLCWECGWVTGMQIMGLQVIG